MSEIKILDKTFRIYIPQNDIEKAIQDVADSINVDMRGKNPVFVVVLNGAFMFAAELFKRINIDCEVCFVKLASYESTQSTGNVRQLMGIDKPLEGRNVVIVEDIVDTGHTINYTLDYLKDKNIADVKIATLFFKPKAYQYSYPLDYVAMDIENEFIVGYGLDYNQQGRNLPDVYILNEE